MAKPLEGGGVGKCKSGRRLCLVSDKVGENLVKIQEKLEEKMVTNREFC